MPDRSSGWKMGRMLAVTRWRMRRTLAVTCCLFALISSVDNFLFFGYYSTFLPWTKEL
jgi:hypothetical protein